MHGFRVQFSVPEVLLSARKALIELPLLPTAIEAARSEGMTRSRRALESAAPIVNRGAATILGRAGDDVKGAILKEAEDWRADLIVVGSNGAKKYRSGSIGQRGRSGCDAGVALRRGYS